MKRKTILAAIILSVLMVSLATVNVGLYMKKKQIKQP